MIIIKVSGGIVQEVITDNPDQNDKAVFVIDEDVNGGDYDVELDGVDYDANVIRVDYTVENAGLVEACRSLFKSWGWDSADEL